MNPPLADISPPEVARNTVLVDLDDPEWNQPIRDFGSDDGVSDRRLGLAFAVRDNIDAENVNVHVELTWVGNSLNWTGVSIDMAGQWDVYSDNITGVVEKPTDVPIMIEFPEEFSISCGVPYTIEITLTQSGDPWDLEEVDTHRFVLWND